MIQVQNVYAKYINNTNILKNCSFTINNKDFVGIIGKNGAGKSTLLKVLCRILKPYLGNICIEYQDIQNLHIKDLARKIAFLPQYVNTNLSFSVFDFILLGRYPYMNTLKWPSQNDYNIVNQIIDLLHLYKLTNKQINQLSYGETQKVLIGQVIAQQTDIIIFDEPTAHLDIGSQNKILKCIKQLNEKYNKTIILTLHDLNIASEFCNKLILLNNGMICKQGTPLEIFQCGIIEKIYNIQFVIGTNPISNKPYLVPIN
ncbi:MAG: ABC transporter ATP-binding protein [Endomicrobium sp.]|jgi:iron complex transport system ATP-binding protein|nr:ABC transporter ATP-binding protein [Endomicrobium sp.]